MLIKPISLSEYQNTGAKLSSSNISPRHKKSIGDFNNIFSMHNFLGVIALCSTIAIFILTKNSEYFIATLSPFSYFIFLNLFLNGPKFRNNLPTELFVYAYCFRMCILPLVSALGDFYMGGGEEQIVQYYSYSIMLMVLECMIVFLVSRFYVYKYDRLIKYTYNTNTIKVFNKKVKLIVFSMAITLFLIVLYKPGVLSSYTVVWNIVDRISLDELSSIQSGPLWYIFDFLMMYFRLIINSLIIAFCLSHQNKKKLFLLIAVILLNIVIISDRRILSLICGISGLMAFYRYYEIPRSIKTSVFSVISIMIFFVIFMFFYNMDENVLAMLSRALNNYFAGPSIGAMALVVNSNYGLQFTEFFKLLYNNFTSLYVLFGSIELQDFYTPTFGYYAWTPMMVGGIRYFGVLHLFVAIFILYYIHRLEPIRLKSKSLFENVLYIHIILSMIAFFIMYTVELLIYNILMFYILEIIVVKKIRLFRHA